MAKRRKQVGKGHTRRMDDRKREQMKQQTRGKSKELEQLRDKLAAAGAELVKAREEFAYVCKVKSIYLDKLVRNNFDIVNLRTEIIHSRIVWFAYGLGAALVAVGAVLMWRA